MFSLAKPATHVGKRSRRFLPEESPGLRRDSASLTTSTAGVSPSRGVHFKES